MVLAFSTLSARSVEVRARAKINLGLEVLGRRPDGYHELRSVMWAIELADQVTLESTGGGITLECTAPDVPPTTDNLAWRAAELVRDAGKVDAGVRIHIDKAIPVAAGLGGGSADAAAVLVGLGALWRVALGRARQRALATAIGMDVPFFLGVSPAVARARGEVLRGLGPPRDLALVLVNPGLPLPTREVYGRMRPEDFGDGRRIAALVRALPRGAAAVARCVVNDLEAGAARLWPGLGEVKAALMEAGCLSALMSGSGPTVAGIAPSAGAAWRIRDALGARPWRVWVTRTVSGPVLGIRTGRGTWRARGAVSGTWGVAKW